jgi:PEGA domain/Family of unknown function (DUF5683)
MSMALKRILTAVFVSCFIFLSLPAAGQEAGNVLVNSEPQGALVQLQGDLALSGVTPVKFDRALSGKYRVEVLREGYENYRSTAYFAVNQQSQLSIKLVPKTKAKAFFRSVIIPGWGQRYYGDRTKSALFAVGTLASAVGYAFVKWDYDDKVDVYNARKADFNAATRWSDLPRLEAQLKDAQKKANDAENIVNVMTAVTAGIYVLNLLDSFLFFPEFDRYTEYKAISVVPAYQPGTASLALSIRF